MRIRLAKRSLPRNVSRHPRAKGILAEADIGVSPRSRLRAKLLVFDNCTHLRHFWRHVLERGSLGWHCRGAVQQMRLKITQVSKDGSYIEWAEVDPRYFCLIGLVHGYLTMEIVTHESVHAGYAYSRRVNCRWPNDADMPEESVCYPSGRIARGIVGFCHDNGLYDPLPRARNRGRPI